MNLLMRLTGFFLFRSKLPAVYKELMELDKKYAGKELHIFYATKPFQYISLKNTGGIKERCCNILVLGAYFINAENFLEKIKKHDGHLWSEIIIIPGDMPEKYTFQCFYNLKMIKEIWSGSDTGFRPAVCYHSIQKRGGKVCIYEEGLGNYVIRRYHNIFPGKEPAFLNRVFVQSFRLLLSKIYGTSFTMGGCRWDDEVYLNYPDFPGLLPSVKPKVRGMKRGIIEHWNDQLELFEVDKLPMFKQKIENKNILVVATFWNSDYEITEDDLKNYDYCIIKFHPHIREDMGMSSNPHILHLQTDIPTEVILLYFVCNNQVTFRSEFSSTLLYLRNSGIKTEFIGGQHPAFLDDIVCYVRNF